MSGGDNENTVQPHLMKEQRGTAEAAPLSFGARFLNQTMCVGQSPGHGREYVNLHLWFKMTPVTPYYLLYKLTILLTDDCIVIAEDPSLVPILMKPSLQMCIAQLQQALRPQTSGEPAHMCTYLYTNVYVYA